MERAYTTANLIAVAQVGADERSKQWMTRKPRSREERAAKELVGFGWPGNLHSPADNAKAMSAR